MLIYFKRPLDNLKKSLAHPGPVLRHRDTKTWSYQNCPFGLRTILAFCLMQGASAKTLTENNENTLGWVFTICFCIYGLVLVTRLLVKGCRALCNFVAVHRPTQSLVYCVAWGLCYLIVWLFRSRSFDEWQLQCCLFVLLVFVCCYQHSVLEVRCNFSQKDLAVPFCEKAPNQMVSWRLEIPWTGTMSQSRFVHSCEVAQTAWYLSHM